MVEALERPTTAPTEQIPRSGHKTGAQRLMEAIERTDPNIYNGGEGDRCIIGQLERSLGDAASWDTSSVWDRISSRYDVDPEVVRKIFTEATDGRYAYDHAAAVEMAREVLGLTEIRNG